MLPVGGALGVGEGIEHRLAEGGVGVEVLVVGGVGGGGGGGGVGGWLGHLWHVCLVAMALAARGLSCALLLVELGMVDSIVGEQRHALGSGAGGGGARGGSNGGGGGGGGVATGKGRVARVGLTCVEGVVGGISRLASANGLEARAVLRHVGAFRRPGCFV